MAKQALIEQTISFLSSDSTFDENAILSNSLIQSLASNTFGNVLFTTLKPYLKWDGTNWLSNWLFEIRCYVTSAFQATIQTNMSQLLAAFPQYQIVTWGYSLTYGF